MSELPDHWASLPLQEVVDPQAPIIYGILQPGPDLADGVPYVRPTEIVDDAIQISELRKTAPAIACRYARASLRGGDVLLSIVGTIGKVAMVPPELEGGNITQSSARIRANRTKLDPHFLAWSLRSPQLRAQFERDVLGTGVPRLNIAQVRALEIGVPPLREQRRIVAKLDALTARSRRAKEALDAIPALLERLRQSVLAAAFRGDLTADWRAKNLDVEPASELLKRIRVERRRRWEEAELAKMGAKGKVPGDDRWKAKYVEPEPVDESELPELPEGWCWASLRDLALDISYGYTASANSARVGPRMLRITDIQDNSVDWNGVPFCECREPDYLLNSGDIVVARTGATTGKSYLLREVPEPAVFASYLIRIRTHSDLTEYAAAYLQSPQYWDQITIVSKGTAQPGANATILAGLQVPLAPLPEQRAIVARIDTPIRSVRRILDRVGEQHSRLKELDNAILAQAFRGELLPQGLDDAPAETPTSTSPTPPTPKKRRRATATTE